MERLKHRHPSGNHYLRFIGGETPRAAWRWYHILNPCTRHIHWLFWGAPGVLNSPGDGEAPCQWTNTVRKQGRNMCKLGDRESSGRAQGEELPSGRRTLWWLEGNHQGMGETESLGDSTMDCA